jgi:beta-glucosidase/6-phospho-beta-glucosidase/beta-galactosidase
VFTLLTCELLWQLDSNGWRARNHVAIASSSRIVRIAACDGCCARFKEDLGLAKAAGCTAFRFSFEWARVEPTRGKYDEAALQRCGSINVRVCVFW